MKVKLAPTRLPPPLKPGDTVCAIAPSGSVRDRAVIEQGLAIWRERGFQVEFGSSWDATDGYLAGSDRQRRKDLSRAWRDPRYKAIVCVRGGYGCTRLLEGWSWELTESVPESADEDDFDDFDLDSTFSNDPDYVATRPKWLVGFSDVTALLWSLAQVGVASVHGPVLSTLAAEPDWSRDRLFEMLAGNLPAPLEGSGWGNGQARGLLLPANLIVASHLLRTPVEPPFQGAILAFEEVAEAPYRIDRLLTHWRTSGALLGVRGIALGRFSRCEAPPGFPSWTVEEVLRDRLQDLEIPIVADLPFGHDGANASLLVGRPVVLDGDGGQLSFVEDARPSPTTATGNSEEATT
ncbi:MAG: LD-carboxypeptidase [Cyanobacteria bacterium J06641_5]